LLAFKGKNMANQYLIEIHNYISEKIAGIQHRIDEADAEHQGFYKGQLDEWLHLRAYLIEQVDLKTQKYF